MLAHVVLNGAVVSVEVQRVRRLIDGLRRDRRVHPHHGRREYSQRAREVIAACEELIEIEPAAVPALTGRAVERITTALMYMDDSSGIVGDDLHVLMMAHGRACTAAPPDARRLAAWLAKMRLDGPGWPDFELRDFTTALGQTGRAELARIVAERAHAVEPDVLGRTPFGIRILCEQLAEISPATSTSVSPLSRKTCRPRRSTSRSSRRCGKHVVLPMPRHGRIAGSLCSAPDRHGQAT